MKEMPAFTDVLQIEEPKNLTKIVETVIDTVAVIEMKTQNQFLLKLKSLKKAIWPGEDFGAMESKNKINFAANQFQKFYKVCCVFRPAFRCLQPGACSI